MQLYMSWYIISFFGFIFTSWIFFIFSSTPVLTYSIDVVFVLSIEVPYMYETSIYIYIIFGHIGCFSYMPQAAKNKYLDILVIWLFFAHAPGSKRFNIWTYWLFSVPVAISSKCTQCVMCVAEHEWDQERVWQSACTKMGTYFMQWQQCIFHILHYFYFFRQDTKLHLWFPGSRAANLEK